MIQPGYKYHVGYSDATTGEFVTLTGSDDLERAKGYAMSWGRTMRSHTIEVRELGGYSANVVFHYEAPSNKGIPMPKPQNPAPAMDFPNPIDFSFMGDA